MSHIAARRGIKRAKKGLKQLNPNLLLGGAIVGVVGLGAVLLWRLLDPRQIPDKVREALGDRLMTNADKTGTPYDNMIFTKKDASTGETKGDFWNSILFAGNPIAGLGWALKKNQIQKEEEEIRKKNQNTWDPSELDPRL